MMYFPGATYRIQFNKSFTFKDLKQIIPYLDALGIKTIYAAPIFDAMPGSVHGYDGTNPNSINPEIGTYRELKEIASMLKERKMGWIQDFVPNHMAYSIKNTWLCDFLEKGSMSAYDTYFDVNREERIMAPFLDSSLETAIEQHQIELVNDSGRLRVKIFETLLPLNHTAYALVSGHPSSDTLYTEKLKKALELLSELKDKTSFEEGWEAFLKNWQKLLSKPYHKTAIEEQLKQLSNDNSFMKQVLDEQFYRLCDWRETDKAVNYRRFFTINSLICVNIHKRKVFDDYHQLLARLVEESIFQGVRIDHIDGLYDPGTYLHDLRKLLGDDVYIVVEKILGQEESIPESWPVQGTTGYDFLAQASNALVDQHGAATLKQFYNNTVSKHQSLSGIIEKYKADFLYSHMQGELHNLSVLFRSIFNSCIPEEITEDAIKGLIAEILVCCPVYRFYIDALPFDDSNEAKINLLLKTIKLRGHVQPAALKFFKDYFVDDLAAENEEKRKELLHFWRRCMQFSGPLMAKGIEDTLVYNYNAFLANNEVGNDIQATGISATQFHERMKAKVAAYPLSMNATATHDTKRGEDSRSRLQYVSVVAQAWLENVQKWLQDTDDGLSAEDKYFMLQIIYSSIDLNDDTEAYQSRFKDFVVKAAREAGRASSWHKPDEAYEAKLTGYGLSLTEEGNRAGEELKDFLENHQEPIALHALVQLVLKCTCPGVPDIYQGTELWDLSFVDPDNRRPVDYESRMKMLRKITASGTDMKTAAAHVTDPAAKLYLLYKLLQLRKAQEVLFEKGSYEPLQASAGYLSFIRSHNDTHLLVVLPTDGKYEPAIRLELPSGISGNFTNVLTGKPVALNEATIQEQLQQFPLLILLAQPQMKERKSGILMPLFSLPSEFGIGGMGQEANDFIAMLSDSKQKLWQLLPLNPVLEENHYSPYACISAFAGDPMYIDPVLLQDEGWLHEKDIPALKFKDERKIPYTKVKQTKADMLESAWNVFKERGDKEIETAFHQFCKEENEWLDDYALFVTIREQQENKPWFQWPLPLRNRDAKALEDFSNSNKDSLDFQKWMQFIFYRQWHNIKKTANLQGISLIGDIPFYVSHNSSDVWANRTLFSVDENGKMLLSAGVPPDYFSEIGQLWLMPTYNWKAVQETGFEWWLRRLQQNVKLFDVVRLDHFRAFYDYWEVPAEHTDAVEGKWKDGPRDALFQLIQQHFPDMPFLAEDLGEIHSGVFTFKDKYGLKGMRILQFGFDPFDGKLRDLPHNFDANTVVYTGTHDNDTTTGWFERLNKKSRKALNQYTGCKVSKKNVHDVLIEMAHRSVATWSIIPLQDILKLDESSRLNTPATTKHNWLWRLLPGEFTGDYVIKLKTWTELFNR